MNKKFLAGALACALVFGAGVGATLAYLKDTAGPVVNTFTEGKVEVKLDETPSEGKEIWQEQAIPGTTYGKDPIVTVPGTTNVDSWLFVKVEKDRNKFIDEYYDYQLTLTAANDWTQGKGLEGEDADGIPTNVYYRSVTASTADQSWYLLEGNDEYPNGCITVDGEKVTQGTEGTMENAKDASLTFTAYCAQKDNLTAAQAWGLFQ